MEYGADFVGGDFIFKNYIRLSLEESIQVLDCRNDEDVRKWMTTDSIIPLKSHLEYIEHLKNSQDKYYWAVYSNQVLIGGVSVLNFNGESGCTGIFINPKLIGSGIGLKVTYYFNEHLFKDLKLEKSYSEICKDNTNAIKLNKFVGATITDKEGQFFDVCCYAADWEKHRSKIYKIISCINLDI